MTTSITSTTPNSLDSSLWVSIGAKKFRFDRAKPEDGPELQNFSAESEMPGAIRFSLDRSPDYFRALGVEGSHIDLLLCREHKDGRLVATGHRAVKPAFLNGEVAPVGYLGGLRVEAAARSAQLLAQGYGCLRAFHVERPAHLYLTTIMEGNRQAREVLLSGRLGLPAYHDFGRFCCTASSLSVRNESSPLPGISIRCATSADGAEIVEFLNREGRAKQFFPKYQVRDFGFPGGLLCHLDWKDVYLALNGRHLVGVLAAWDQRPVRRWKVTGYAPWLDLLRVPLNLVARLRHLPPLPSPHSSLSYFILSLVCIQNSERKVFKALLQEMIRAEKNRFKFFLAGLHERDPLLPELLNRPHVPFFSRLCVVGWKDVEPAIQNLDRGRVPYLELGSL